MSSKPFIQALLVVLVLGAVTATCFLLHPRRHFPDLGQPARAHEVLGWVESKVGNQIVVAKFAKPDPESMKNWRRDRESKTPEERIAFLENLRNSETGEQMTVIVPAGTPVMDRQTQQSVGVENIDEQKMVVVWLDNEHPDQNIAQFIIIQSVKND